jgi:formate hydrogenlyase subunit 4
MHEQINQYVTQVLLAALALLTVLIKLWLEGLKKKAEAYYEARTTAEQRQTLALLGKEAPGETPGLFVCQKCKAC